MSKLEDVFSREPSSEKFGLSPLKEIEEELENLKKSYYVPKKGKPLDWWWGAKSPEKNTESLGALPQGLKEYRWAWEENMDLDQNKKERIKNEVEKIPVRLDVDSDGSRLVEFQLNNKTYKILDPKLNNHTDDGYGIHAKYNSITQIDKYFVTLRWMMWDNVNEWKNQKLKQYVKKKQKEWLHIPKIEEMKTLLEELWKTAWLTNEMDQVAMFMYLTWMDGSYWLATGDDKTSGNKNLRSRLDCDDASDGDGCFYCSDEEDYDASLLMISVN